jgi:hypothetical protein
MLKKLQKSKKTAEKQKNCRKAKKLQKSKKTAEKQKNCRN